MKAVVLRALREAGGYVSAQELSREVGASRASISHSIRGLQKHGYVIESSRRGYRLVSSPDLLLPCEFAGLEHRIHYFSEIGSTMDVARELARTGAEGGTIVIAEAQTSGRGRLGREWVSPGGGIYITVILRPEIKPEDAPLVSLMASVAVAAAIRALYGLKAVVKWPNDVLIGGKKVCGILAEMESEMDAVRFINVGIGINTNTAVPEFAHTATSLKQALGKEISRQEFLGALLTEIERRQDSVISANVVEEWKEMSATLGQDVQIAAADGLTVGRAVDIDRTGALILRQTDGSLKKVMAGDCSH